jgi:hypothetical protein
MLKCGQNWTGDLDELTDEEFDSFIEHADSCRYHAMMLEDYEKETQPIMTAALEGSNA